jgi:hypothetical protein
MRNWKERARAARTLARGIKYGEREKTLSAMADGNDVNTLRRAVKALDFLETVQEAFPKLGHRLDTEAFSALEILARWSDFDQTAAIEAARELAAGKLNVKSLQSAMRAARCALAPSVRKPDPSTLAQMSADAIGALLGGRIRAVKTSKDTSSSGRILLRLNRRGGAPETVEAVVIGPYTNVKLYHKRCHTWCWRGLGMAWTVDHVVLLLPSPDHLEEYRSWLSDALLNAKTAARTAKSGQTIGRLPSVQVLAVEVAR